MLSNYQLEKIKNNLTHFYKLANDNDFIEGVQWYKDAHLYCVEIAKEYNTSLEIVANVLSALSPRNRWKQNKKDTITIFEAVKLGISPESIKVCTFHQNKRKAYQCAKGNLLITKNSAKTFAFVQNIAYLDDNYITIDVWHIRAAFDKMRIKKTLTKLEYYQLEKLTINLARKYGMKGFEFQAIIWCAIRNNY